MYKRKTLALLSMLWILTIQQRAVEAGPMNRLNRMVREVYPPDIEPETEEIQPQVCIVGDVVYGVDEQVPAEQPCLKCRCQPPGVICETTRCVKKPGCKAIHRPNKCCPDYQCECQHNGKLYGNGERLETPLGGECKVCYCRGGEIQCAEVSCYIRKDCEGKTVPGQCCPKYDHCPPIDTVLENTYTTELTITNVDPDTLEVLPLPPRPAVINETIITVENSNDQQEDNKIFDSTFDASEINNKLSENRDLEIEDLERQDDLLVEQPKITIQEIIPEIKEIPITPAPKIEEISPQTQGQLIIEEAKEPIVVVENTSNELAVTDSEPDSSEISEVFQHPPPVLRIGDKLLFLKKGEFIPEKDTSTPASIITIIGAEGLQRGFEESGEAHEEHADSKTTEHVNINKQRIDITDNNDLEPKESDHSHILSLVKRKKQAVVTTTEQSTTSLIDSILNNTDGSASTDVPVTSTTEVITTIIPKATTYKEASTQTILTSDLPESLTTTEKSINLPDKLPSTDASIHTETIKHEAVEQNPAYPPIPDVMVSLGETLMDDTSQRFDNKDKDNNDITTKKLNTQDYITKAPQNIYVTPSALEFDTSTSKATSEAVTTIKSDVTIITSDATTIKSDLTTIKADETTIKFDLTTFKSEPTTLEPIETSTDTISTTPEIIAPIFEMKILPEILDKRSNKTVPYVTLSNWLKKDDDKETNKSVTVLSSTTTSSDESSDDLLNKSTSTASYVETTSESKTVSASLVENMSTSKTMLDLTTVLPETTSEIVRSIEKIDILEDSGEKTTEKPNHESIKFNENASVEKELSEMSDMLEENGSKKSTVVPLLRDVEFIGEIQKTDDLKPEIIKDVEIFNVEAMNKNLETSTRPEELPKPEKIVEYLPKSVGKRENSQVDEGDEVFRQLDDELNSPSTEKQLTKEEEDKEADEIFKELLNESDIPKIEPSPEGRNKDTDALQRVSDALAKFTLKGKHPDTSILGILSNFFSSQYRYRK